ncbi:hypothetical protein [Halorarius halobius]|uniref:hypothetical protein n=1 Tax=Halorarius halobius TaxID=2962671 RepID=UPI0020CF5601|nr:hypothetical protein [Halorarius halobius]
MRLPGDRPLAPDVLGVYTLLLALVGARATDILPDVTLLVYVPAVAAALLVDTALHNVAGLTRTLYYPLVVLFTFPYAVALVVAGRWLGQRLRG